MAKRPEVNPEMDQLKKNILSEKGYQTNGDFTNTKVEVAKDIGVPLKKGYNGELTAKQAGKVGGTIGGSMVHEMVKFAQQNLRHGKK